MPFHCVNKNSQASTGDHEVHDVAIGRNQGCLPSAANQYDLGFHPHCRAAVTAAQRVYSHSDGCKHCIPQCHTS